MHAAIRDELKDGAARWRGVINSSIEKYKNESIDDDFVVGLVAVSRDENGCCGGEVNLLGDFIEYMEYLVRKNASFVNLACRYASSEIVEGTE